MNSNYYNEQVLVAQENYNYFFAKLICCIMQIFIKLSIVLLIDVIFNFTIINIISLIYVIYAMMTIFKCISYYMDIIYDIKNTLNLSNLSFEIDFSLIHYDFFKGIVEYGK